jgi:uncharacterized protein (DUF427 family)
MNPSPGHARWPTHQVRETHVAHPMKVEVDGEVVADSRDVIRVDEDGYPARFYFPRGDVRTDLLESSNTRSMCPFKGEASYYSLDIDDKRIDDAVWTYETPYDEHADLRGRLAFWDDKNPEISIQPR